MSISSPFSSTTTTVFAVVVEGNCSSDPVAINLDVENIIEGSIAVATEDMCPGTNNSLIFSFSENTLVDVEITDGSGTPIQLTGISDGHVYPISPTTTTTYTLTSIIPQNSICTGTIALNQVTVNVIDISVEANPTSDFNGFGVSCTGSNDGSATATPLTGVSPYTYFWNDGSQTETISNISAGEYMVTITDANGCTASATTTITEPTAIQVNAISVSPSCDEFNGSITLENISGGVGPYEFSFDGSSFSQFSNNATTVELPVGNYDLTIMDANDCEISDNLSILESPELMVELGDDLVIPLGDSIQLEPQTNFTPVEIIWSENINCENCPAAFVQPLDQTTYTVTMIDEDGCTATDFITITVEKERKVFIPNAFSPDDNGINDLFIIYGGNDVAQVNTFRIFNRWGALLFEQTDFQPNDFNYGWNGYFKNQKLSSGVYVYFAEIEFVDGEKIIYKGDVTLK